MTSLFHQDSPALFSRRGLLTGAVALGGAALCAHAWHVPRVLAAEGDPLPIPGQQPGVGLPPNVHVYLPQPGREPNTIFNFQGFIATSEFEGKGADQTGSPLLMSCDIRMMAGEYAGMGGVRRRGTFAFI